MTYFSDLVGSMERMRVRFEQKLAKNVKMHNRLTDRPTITKGIY